MLVTEQPSNKATSDTVYTFVVSHHVTQNNSALIHAYFDDVSFSTETRMRR